MLRARGRGADIEVRSFGALEVCCRRLEVEVWASGGGQQVCRRGSVCLKSSGAPEVHCRHVDVEVLRSGAREACWGLGGVEMCPGPEDVEVFASRDLELGRRAA